MTGFAIAAAVLVAEGVDLVVVGSTALSLHGESLEVHDLDLVVAPRRSNLERLASALGALAAFRYDIPPLPVLEGADIVTVATAYGRVDLMLAQGRRRFAELAARAREIAVCAVPVPVASIDDAWALRSRFKEPLE